MSEYSCRKCGVMSGGNHSPGGVGFNPLKLCDVCSSSIQKEDKNAVQEFADMLAVVKLAKTKKQRAAILLQADRDVRSRDCEPVFSNCNVCGIVLRGKPEFEMGMCDRCADE